MVVLQINSVVNKGSTGRIVEGIGECLINKGHISYAAFGRNALLSSSQLIKIGNRTDILYHGLISRLSDSHGFGSKKATIELTREIIKINPDIIHLHLLHGYYLNSDILFNFLQSYNKPIVWTQHDCWAFTGHCTHFDFVNCYKWMIQCYKCPNLSQYPKSYFDKSRRNFIRKKEIFTRPSNVTIVAPSEWLSDHLHKSFLNRYRITTLYNGIDTNLFRPFGEVKVRSKHGIKDRYVLSVANVWTVRKGFNELISLRKLLPPEIDIVIVGLDGDQIRNLPKDIIGITRTDDINELVGFYSEATAFVNPTFVDNFPTTNIEALACGIPVVTYNTGGSPESVDCETGFVVKKGDITGLVNSINQILYKGKAHYSGFCRARALKHFNINDMHDRYLSLYHDLVTNQKQ